jgi:hypothetical protein
MKGAKAAEPKAGEAAGSGDLSIFRWLEFLPCCDGWGLFHTGLSSQAQPSEPEPPAPLPEPRKLMQ